jgi:predicted GIY-YIG superfamily endonuclease
VFLNPERSEGLIMEKAKWVTYILQCSDGSFYTGITNNIKNRIQKHNTGNGAKYTQSRIPVKLIYQEETDNKSTARKREIEIKGWSREKKKQLVAGFLPPLKAVSG